MRTSTLTWESWRASIGVLREQALHSMRERADHIERLLEQHGPYQATVTLHLTDDLFLRFSTWAR